MTTALAVEYIPRRMRELGFGDDYFLRFRHFVLKSGEQVEIEAYNQLFILLDDPDTLKITSEFGNFDLSDDLNNEHAYEHQGLITILNYSPEMNHARFIQVIPKYNAIKK